MHLLLRSAAVAVLLALAPAALAQDLAPRVYPNPISTDRAVTVEVADAAAATVEVVDVLGRVVSSEAPLAAGTYLIRARYADGRVTLPTSVTVASPGPIELRLAETASPAGWSGAAPEAALVDKRGGCAPDAVLGGMYFQANVGTLTPRPDLSPASLRVKTVGGTNTADFTTCFGEVQGTAFRYIAGGDPGNRPMRILSPNQVGNTSVTYEVAGSVDGTPAVTTYGWQETLVGNTPTDQFFLSSPFFPGLGLFELIVVDDGVVVQRGIYDGADGLYVSSQGPEGRINLLRSILLSSIVDGFEVSGGTKPGDASFVFEMESGDGSNVYVHAGAGAPIVASGDAIHITPKFAFDNPFNVFVHEIRTIVTGMNRFGIRALRYAVGGSTDPLIGSEAQFTRVSRDFLTPQATDVFGAQAPFIVLNPTLFGVPDPFGLQFGREPGGLEESGSDEIGVFHLPGVLKGGGSGVILNDAGEYYNALALLRNETDVEGESVAAVITNTGSGVSLTVTNEEGTFSTYQFVYDADADGTNNIVGTLPVGVPQIFSPNALTVLASGASDFDDSYNDAGSTQDFFVAFLIDLGNGNGGIVYVFPDFTSANADVDVRAYGVEANQTWEVYGLRERDETDPPMPLTLFGGQATQK